MIIMFYFNDVMILESRCLTNLGLQLCLVCSYETLDSLFCYFSTKCSLYYNEDSDEDAQDYS